MLAVALGACASICWGVADFLGKMAAQRGQRLEEYEKEFVRAERPSSLIGRLASVDEVASMIVYVCSDQASATTGAALRVDGGVVRSIA